MRGPAKRKCLCCQEFYRPDHRDLRHQRHCSKAACRKASKAQSQRRWQQRPERDPASNVGIRRPAEVVISYELYCQIRLLHQERGLNFAQIARELHLDEETVAKWARAKSYIQRSSNPQRKSKLDPYKVIIQRWLERHSYTATQIFQRLRAEEGYTGGFTILTDYVRTIRRVRAPAFLTLAFAPGECAQVDWGCAGSMSVGSTSRRLSFFVMVLCYSRLCYVEFSLGEATEHFLQAHQNAFEFFEGVPAKVLIDFVPRNKIDIMCPAALCGLAWASAFFAGWST